MSDDARDEAQRFRHRWKLSWPGNICLDCGEDDPFEKCVMTSGCVCTERAAVHQDAGAGVQAFPLPNCKVQLTPCPAKALAQIRQHGDNGDVNRADSNGVDAYPSEKRRFVDALEHVAGIKLLFISDESALSDFGISDSLTAQLADRLDVPVSPDDFVVDILCRMRALSTAGRS